MKIRSLMVRGAVAAALAAGGTGLTSAAAHASTTACGYLQGRANYYRNISDLAWALYITYVSAGRFADADEEFDWYVMDYSIYQYYVDRFNSCNFLEP